MGASRVVGFTALALVAPEAGETDGGAEFEQPRVLTPRDGEAPLETILRIRVVFGHPQQLPSKPDHHGVPEVMHQETKH
jgi:hypothetical protein